MLKVLIADDEQLIRMRLIKAIDWYTLDMQVCGEAANGEELLRQTAIAEPDIIITDIRMPLMDGIEYVEKLRKTTALSPVIIIISGFADFEYAQKLIKLGIDDYILKPIDKEKFYDTLKQARQKAISRKGQTIQAILNSIKKACLWKQEMPATSLPDEYHMLLISIHTGADVYHSELLSHMKELADQLPDFHLEILQHNSNILNFAGVYRLDSLELFIQEFQKWINSRNIILFWTTLPTFIQQIHYEIGCFTDFCQSEYHYKSFGCTYYVQNYFLGNQNKNAIDYTIFTEWEKQLKLCFNKGSLENLNSILEQMLIYLTNTRFSYIDLQNQLFILLNHLLTYSVEQNLTNSLNQNSLEEKLQLLMHEQFIAPLLEKAKQFVLEIFNYNSSENNHDLYACVRKIKSYINIHYHEDISLNELAEYVELSPAYISHIFSENTGMTIKNYIKEKRMQQAEYLLKETTLKVYEISDQIGINNVRYFSNLFKERTGLTPNDYRNRFGSDQIAELQD